MTTYHRFPELVARGYVKNRMTLKRRIDAGVFPPPCHLGPNSVAWTDEQLAGVDARIAAGEFRSAAEGDRQDDPQPAEPTPEINPVENPRQRKRGRPKGSRNKPKQPLQPSVAAA